MKLFFLFLALSFSIVTYGKEVYKWTDENGKIHFSDKKPGNSAAEKKPTVIASTGDKIRPEEEIRKGIEKSKGKIYSIYNKASKNNPSTSGKFVVKIEISGSGKVMHSSIIKSELQDHHLEYALLTEIEKIDFGKGNYRNTSLIHTFDFLQQKPTSKAILTAKATRSEYDKQKKPKAKNH